MKKLLPFFLFVLLFFQAAHLQAQYSHQKIDPYLSDKMQSAEEGVKLPAYVVLKERLSLEHLENLTAFLPRKEKQREVVRLLKEFAQGNQQNVLSYLRGKEAQNLISNIEIIWAINVIAFKADAASILSLAEGFGEVEKIHYDPAFPYEMLFDDNGITLENDGNGSSVETMFAPQPGLTLINAPAVWAAGDSGRGVLVANIDSGTDWKHPDLAKNIWNNLGEDANGNGYTMMWNGSTWVFDPGDVNGIDDDNNGHIDDFIGWDYSGNDNDPSNGSSHGTATSGIVAGYGTNGTQTGVAPAANLIILKPGGESQYWSAQQYAMDKGADIVTSSLSYKWYFNPKPNYPMFRQMTDMELAAGMVHTNSTSNDGGSLSSAPIPFNISAPGNNPGPWVHPDQTLVGGLSSVIGSANVLASTDLIVSSSPHGPATWENIQQNNPSYPYVMPMEYRDYPYQTSPGSMGLLKPDVAAPGNGTVSTNLGGGYQNFSGTSGATPHLAGVAALMLGANPNLMPADVSRIMQLTSVEKGAPGKDNRYGAGRVDAWEAYQMVIAELPVELSAFNASVSANDVSISWTTATEINNKGFEVERKSNNTWHMIYFIEGKGNSTEYVNYTYTDKAVDAGNYAYRLKQVDYDGTFEYSNEINVVVAPPAEFSLKQNYPNPFNPETVIEFSIREKSDVTVSVYNTLGELISTLIKGTREAGIHKVNFNASSLTSGIYLYRITSKSEDREESAMKKMILIK